MTRIVHQLSLNENCSPPLPGVREALLGSVDQVHLTLDALADGLAAELAGHLGVAAERVVAGAGSGALLQQFLAAHCGPGSEVVHTWPSFEMYPLLIRNAHARPVAVPAPDDRQDLAAVAAAVTPETKVVLLCNPNNPTGEVLGADRLRALLEALPPHVLVLVDEAYREFADPAAVADAVELAATDDRVVVVRTFSKSHGLLGLRVGYLVGAADVVAPVRRTTPFYRVPTVAQAAAVAALAAGPRMRRQCERVAAERDRVRAGLLELGFDVPPSGGNFLWLRLGARNQEFVAHLAEHGIAVRVLAGGAGVRVSTGTPEANDAVLRAAALFASAPAPAPALAATNDR
ncbi:aminotransferase class I/II-fold pyridoxal phosphate-dependent enzyme [Saccharothrix coeruleofusca]|uniref:Phenylalanine aminotransferase n=1 Tax=Saccharothrix coeruleofusca TaxID=33919 RepID=A0A918EHV1_9PSEU|nr:aminotransferase class I/II-fold pyridoxal phosphate-dependent enzyme [Saccharothrix coeruleofusca]MBP2335595.1 histidinol-phosphate aminotransferase [Saccharothrix coeruleofusca]GGP79485.1 putative phenylalanine aminotransferase [Saccharothrix coeruleofusca]